MDRFIRLTVLGSFIGIFITGCSTTTSHSAGQTQSVNSSPSMIGQQNNAAKKSLIAVTLQQWRRDLGLANTSSNAIDNKTKAQLIKETNEFIIIQAKKANRSPTLLTADISLTQLSHYVDNLFPRFNQVTKLRSMMQYYRTLVNYAWPPLAEGSYSLGQRNKAIEDLRTRLTILGDLAPSSSSKYRQGIFDPKLIEGVKLFQQRHGIDNTGELNKITIAQLNKTPLMRLALMQKNLWRWLQLPKQLPSDYLWVNLPEYSLKLYEQQQLMINMPVIVGKPKSKTPVMTTKLTHLTINPTWTPPFSIIRDELLPLHHKHPSYLKYQAFKLHKGSAESIPIPNTTSSQLKSLLKDYRLVQAPGPKNALGKFKFTIPNQQAIYLHDTPAKHLFAKKQRALSHGCIRLKDAANLSRYILAKDKPQNSERFDVTKRPRVTRTHRLTKPLAVFITYHTSWVDAQGTLQFRPDIYQLDAGV